MKTWVIAEAGVNHNGSIQQALKLVDVAVHAGADAVKFQTFKTENLVTQNTELAEYQQGNSEYKSQFELLKNLELNESDHQTLIEYCQEKHIEFMSTPFDLESLALLENLNIRRYKIPSGEITNLPLLRAIAKLKKPIILSTGMSDLKEVKEAIDHIKREGFNLKQLTILHANTEYPTPMQDVHLKAMVAMGEYFKINYGYSDHTPGTEIPIAAVALGASVIEKHFTLDKNATGPDHKASLSPEELKSMIQSIRNIEQALGTEIKQASPSETKNKDIARKSIVAKRVIKKGETFDALNLTTKRPGTGLSPMKWDELIGTTASKDYLKDELI